MNDFQNIVSFYESGAITLTDCCIQLVKMVTKENVAELMVNVTQEVKNQIIEEIGKPPGVKIWCFGWTKDQQEKETELFNSGLDILRSYLK